MVRARHVDGIISLKKSEQILYLLDSRLYIYPKLFYCTQPFKMLSLNLSRRLGVSSARYFSGTASSLSSAEKKYDVVVIGGGPGKYFSSCSIGRFKHRRS